jgi:hypothetical protein
VSEPPAGTGRIVVELQREGIDTTARVSLAPGVLPPVSVPPDVTVATFDAVPPGTYTVSLDAFGCSRPVEVGAGASVLVRVTIAPVAGAGGFRCTITRQ